MLQTSAGRMSAQDGSAVLHTATSALRHCSISVPADLFLNCQHKGFVIKGSIMTLPVDKERRGPIDAATDATAEVGADTRLECAVFERFSKRFNRHTQLL